VATIDLASPFAMKNARLSIGADDYSAAVSQAEFQPTTNTASWRAINGNTVQNVDSATWVLALGLAQDDDPAGLSRYLLAHEGEEVPVTLVPVVGGTSWAATVVLTPGAIGGTAGADLAGAQVNLPVIGKPVPTDAP
jgi:hypothetical protein